MNDERTAALRERAREWGGARLESPPWDDLAGRLALLLVDPPLDRWASAGDAATLWLLLSAADARTLSAKQREPLLRDGRMHERASADGAPSIVSIDLIVFTVERLEETLDGVGRRSLEARWSVRHAASLEDPLRRHEPLAAAAARLPDDAPARIVRPLYAQARAALDALDRMARARMGEAVIAAGEAAGALSRLACVLEEGAHPPSQWLGPAARETELGRRIASWLDDLPRALGGDEAAARRVADGCEAVGATAEAALRPRFGTEGWFLAARSVS